MTHTPTDDHPGFVAEEPELCRDCNRLIRPGQRYFPTKEQAVVCPDYIRASDAIRLSGGLAFEVRQDRLLVRSGGALVRVFPREVWRLVDAPVKAATSLAGGQRREEQGEAKRSSALS